MTEPAPSKSGYQPGLLFALVVVAVLAALALAGVVLVAHESTRVIEFVWSHT